MPFEDEWLLRQRDLTAAFGEGFILEPLAFPDLPAAPGRGDVNGRPVSSLNRILLPFDGIFVQAGSMEYAQGRRMADSATHTIASEKPMIDVSNRDLPQRPQFGDIIRRLKTDEVFTVEAYVTEAPTQAWIYLAEGKRREVQPR